MAKQNHEIDEKDKKKAELIFRTMFILGTIAIVGFIVAICIHASLRGDGSIVEGMKNIIKEDVLRRTNGGDLNEFSPNYWQSFNPPTRKRSIPSSQ